MTIWGTEGIHTWNGVALNDLDGWPGAAVYKLDRITGLSSLGDAEDSRDVNTGRVGETARRSFRRGKTITYEGRIWARGRVAMRNAEAVLRAAFADQTREYTMTVDPPAFATGETSKQFNARALVVDIPDEETSPHSSRLGHERPFAISVRLSDPRYYDEDLSTLTMTLPGPDTDTATAGTATVEPKIEIDLPSVIPTSASPDGLLGIGVDSSGNIYVSDSIGDRVVKYDSSGRFVLTFGSHGTGNGQFDAPNGIACDSSGNVFVADAGNRRVQKFNSSGVYQSQFGTSGTGNGQFLGPTSLAIDSSDNIFVGDSVVCRVQKFNSSGTYQMQFGSNGSGNGQFFGVGSIAFDSSGNIYVADSDNFQRVQKFNSSGVYQSKISAGPIGGDYIAGLAIDGSGNIYLCWCHLNRVDKYNSSLAFQSSFTPSGATNLFAMARNGTELVLTTYSAGIVGYSIAGAFQRRIGDNSVRVENLTTGAVLRLVVTSVDVGDTLTVNFATSTVKDQDGNDRSARVDVAASTWLAAGAVGLAPGANSLRVSSAFAATKDVRVKWTNGYW